MLQVAINGKFVADRMQGIVRYARELVTALDDVLDAEDDVRLVIPPNAKDVPSLSRIRVVRWGSHTGLLWEQLDFARYLRKRPELLALNLCNVAPLVSRPGVTAIHDIMYRVCAEFYVTPRNKVSRLWHCLQYSILTRRERAILTVSDYSKREIEKYYPHACGKVSVVPNGWQHVLAYEEAKDWQERYPQLEPGSYLFCMATLARNKNVRWVYEVARRNPKLTFAIAGKRYESDELDCPPNVQLLGFVCDADACALIKNCRAFLYPSLYEGFGLPPLEALALGARVISSNATSLPEVMGDSAYYIDPFEYDVDLEALLNKPVTDSSNALDKYSWTKSAHLLASAVSINKEGSLV